MLQYYRPRACGLKMAALACGLVLMVGGLASAQAEELEYTPNTPEIVIGSGNYTVSKYVSLWNPGGNVHDGSATVNNVRVSGGTLTVGNSSSAGAVEGGTFTLTSGTVSVGGDKFIDGDNTWTGGSYITGGWGNPVAVNLTGGTVNLGANGRIQTTRQSGDGAVAVEFRIGGNAVVNMAGTNGNASVIRANGSYLQSNTNDHTYGYHAKVIMSGGTVNVTGHGVILSRETALGGGVINVGSGGRLTVAGSATATAGNRDVVNGILANGVVKWGTFAINGGRIENAGVIDFVTGAMTLSARGGELTGNLNLTSSVGTTPGTTYSNNLHVLAGGSFRIGGNLDIAGGMTFDNKGSLTVTGHTSAANALTLAAGSSTTFGGGLTASAGLTVENRATAAFGADSTVTGSAVFKSGSTFAIDAKNKLSVTGGATIEAGAMADVRNIDTIDAVGRTILEAGRITGQFDATGKSLYTVETVDNVVRITGRNNIGDVLARNDIVTGNSVAAGVMASAVMNDATVDSTLRTNLGNAITKITSLAANDPAEARIVAAQLFGEHALAGSSATHAAAQAYSGSTANRQIQVRENRQATALAPVSSDGAYAALRTNTRSSSVRNATVRRAPGTSSFDPNRVWLAGFGAFARQSDKDGSFGYKYNAGGFILGYDREMGDFVFGVSTAYSGGRVKNNEGLTATDVDTFNIGLYGSYNHPTGFFVDGNAGFGLAWNDTATTDAVSGGGLRKEGSYRNTSFQLGSTVGYVFSLPAETRIIPSLGLQYTHVHQQGWSESVRSRTQLANWFAGANDNYLSLPLQVRANKTFRLAGDASITPELRAAWVFEAIDPRTQVRMGYVGSGASTTLHGLSSGRSRGIIGMGVKAKFARRLDAFVDYNLEFRNRFTNHNIMAGMGVSF